MRRLDRDTRLRARKTVLAIVLALATIASRSSAGETVETSGPAFPVERSASSGVRDPIPSVGVPSDDALAHLVEHLLEARRLLRDPWDARESLETHGLFFDLFANYQLGANAHGGASTNASPRSSHSLDYFARFETAPAGLWEGGQALLLAKTNRGRNINPDVGALSDPIDDADADEALWIDQLWYQQVLAGGTLQIRAGYLDLQGILDRNAYANREDTQFASAWLDNNNAIIPLKVGLGAALWLRPAEWLQLVTGVSDADNEVLELGFDTAFDDFRSLLVYAEGTLSARLPGPSGPLPGSYRLGVFHDPRDRRVFGSRDPVTGGPVFDSGDVGYHLSLDQLVYRESEKREEGLGVFFRYGNRDSRSSRVAHFASLGCQYLGPIPGRDDDAVGVAMYQAVPSSRLRHRVARDFSRETGVEAYYRWQVTPSLAISPIVQHITNPGGLRSARDSVVLLLRVRVTL